MELKIEYLPISKLKPYEKNARKHADRDIDNIALSIQKYGMNDAIGIWGKDNVIVEGHGRLLACKKLGIDKIPCVRLDHLSDKERREYAIAHNATAELSEWGDLSDLEELDLSDFDFDLHFDIDGIKTNARERTYNSVNLLQYDATRTEGFYEMPVIKAVDYIPQDLIGFNYIKSTPDHEKTVHFFIDDYQFERIWNSPDEIIERIRPFAASLTPDFSLYMDMPMAMKIWNVYRSRLIGQMMQDRGIVVIPTLSWAEDTTYEFCFDGLEHGGVYAVSTVGVMRSTAAKETFADGLKEAIFRLEPKAILLYGSQIDFDFGNIKIYHYKAREF